MRFAPVALRVFALFYSLGKNGDHLMVRFSVACLLAIPLVAFTYFASAQEKGDHSEHWQACAKACEECARACDICAIHCGKLVDSGKKEHKMTEATCKDCSTICAAAAAIVKREGPFSTIICEACAESCKRCGEACEKHGDDSVMKKCAEECRKCEKACREMLKMHTSNK
jgi:hypothetical protein